MNKLKLKGCETPQGAAQKVHEHERKMHPDKPLTKLPVKTQTRTQTQTKGYGR